MSMDALDRTELPLEAQKKLEECVAMLAAYRFGEQGPPLETTFAEIEMFGHHVGRMVAQAVDEKLAAQHADHFQGQSECPACQHSCEIVNEPLQRKMQTTDGDVPISEPLCHCPVCNRDFFPSADRFED